MHFKICPLYFYFSLYGSYHFVLLLSFCCINLNPETKGTYELLTTTGSIPSRRYAQACTFLSSSLRLVVFGGANELGQTLGVQIMTYDLMFTIFHLKKREKGMFTV